MNTITTTMAKTSLIITGVICLKLGLTGPNVGAFKQNFLPMSAKICFFNSDFKKKILTPNV